MIISVHLPKVAGSSFKSFLNHNFKLYHDYSDKPFKNEDGLNRVNEFIKKNNYSHLDGFNCVHGHFLAKKYSVLKNVDYVTWVREPISRLKSNYLYLKNTPNGDNSYTRRIVRDGASFMEFCEDYKTQDVQSKFMVDFDVNKFKFIGIYENIQNDMNLFCKIFDLKESVLPKSNITKNKEGFNFGRYDVDKIKEMNYNDYEFYEFSKIKNKEINESIS